MSLKVTRLPFDGLYYFESDKGAPRFSGFEGGIGWLNPDGADKETLHWAVVAGRAEDKRIVIVEEAFAALDDLALQMIDLKDRFYVRPWYVDGRNESCVRSLRTEREYDGLCRYVGKPKDSSGRPRWLHEAKHWPNFRDRDLTAALIPVPEGDLLDLQAGWARLVGAIRRKETEIHVRCSYLRAATQLPVKDVLEHPGIRATIWVHNAMRLKDNAGMIKPGRPAYPNMRR